MMDEPPTLKEALADASKLIMQNPGRGTTPCWIFPAWMVDAHKAHMAAGDQNHTLICSIEECPQREDYLRRIREEYEASKQLCREKLGDTWDRIPLEEQVVIATEASRFLGDG